MSKLSTLQKAKEETINLLRDALNNGVIPWQPPFLMNCRAHHGIDNKIPYRGSNAIITELFSIMMGYSSRIWLTYPKYIELAKANPTMKMKPGSKAVPIICMNFVEKKDKETGEPVKYDNGRQVYIVYYEVKRLFNADCFTGYDFMEKEDIRLFSNPEIIPSCQELEDMLLTSFVNAPKVLHDVQDRAFYRIDEDTVHLPSANRFVSTGEFLSTLAHELAHSTGHRSRLYRKSIMDNRPSITTEHRYDFEELIAEIAASIICVHFGHIETVDNSASYIYGWSTALRDNPDWFYKAFGYAEKAADMILGITSHANKEIMSEVPPAA